MMTDDAPAGDDADRVGFRQLIEGCIEGRLDAAERERLAEIMENDGAAAAEVRSQMALSRCLEVVHAPADGRDLASRVLALVQRQRPSQRIQAADLVIRRIRDRGVAMRRPRRQIRIAGPILAAAAALMVALVLWQALPSSVAAPPAMARILTGRAALLGGPATVLGPGTPLHRDAAFAVLGGCTVAIVDGTRIAFADGRYVLREDATGRQVGVDEGALDADIVPQPVGQKLRFTTPHAEVEVVGTRLALQVDGRGTRLDVSAGRVRLRGRGDGNVVEVAAQGHAVVGTDRRLVQDGRVPLRPVPAQPADALLACMGLNTWLGQPGSCEDRRFDEVMVPRLRELGVRHLRDVADLNRDPARNAVQRERWRRLADLGLDAVWVLPGLAVDAPTVAHLHDIGGPCLRILQGADEPERLARTGDIQTLLAATCRLREAVNSAAPGIAVAGMTFSSPSLLEAMGDCRDLIDHAAMKHMLAGHHPENAGWGDDGYGSIDWAVRQAGIQGRNRPVLFARAGYHNATTQRNGHPGAPEPVVATYLPRLVLGYAEARVGRAYIAELVDRTTGPRDPIAASWGLLRQDGSPKPAFHAFRNLAYLFADPGPAFVPAALPLDLPAGPQVRHRLFQRRDGTHLLALWLAEPCYDPEHGQLRQVPERTVTLRLAGPAMEVRLHAFDENGQVTVTGLPAVPEGDGLWRISLTVRDRLGVLAIAPIR